MFRPDDRDSNTRKIVTSPMRCMECILAGEGGGGEGLGLCGRYIVHGPGQVLGTTQGEKM